MPSDTLRETVFWDPISSVKIKVVSESAEIQFINSDFLRVLFSCKPFLGAKFYKYLSRCLLSRMHYQENLKFPHHEDSDQEK